MLTLLGHLENRGTWSGTELAELLGVSARTLRRDIDRIRSLGYIVEADAGPGGGYALGRGQVLPPLLLDDEQALAVALALLRLATSVDGPMADTALAALARLHSLLPNAVHERLKLLRQSTSFVTNDAEIGTLLECSDAIRRQLRAEFSYTDRNGMQTTRRVEPHRLVIRNRTWLLLAFDLSRDDWRSFRLDRITCFTIGTWHFAERAGVEEALGQLEQPIPVSAWKHQVEVEIAASRVEIEKAIPYLTSYLVEIAEARTILTAGAANPDEAAWWLSRIPFEFRVLGDSAVVEAVAQLAERLRAATQPTAR